MKNLYCVTLKGSKEPIVFHLLFWEAMNNLYYFIYSFWSNKELILFYFKSTQRVYIVLFQKHLKNTYCFIYLLKNMQKTYIVLFWKHLKNLHCVIYSFGRIKRSILFYLFFDASKGSVLFHFFPGNIKRFILFHLFFWKDWKIYLFFWKHQRIYIILFKSFHGTYIFFVSSFMLSKESILFHIFF